MESPENRLTVHRASRTERLAEELIAQLRHSKPVAALAPRTIVIPHVGMRRWLLQTIAKSAPRGIAANIDTQLPWQWLQATARRVLGDAALVGGDYNADTLRWHVHAAIGSVASPVLDAYLTGEDRARRRFVLAARLTDVFSQYLVYRPDMILRWERGESRDDWQAQLWRRVRAGIRTPHRAERLPALVDALNRNGDGEREPLHVFGVSELPPDVLASLHALGAHRDIHIYFPDPCRQYWTFLRPRRALLAQENAEAMYFEVGHPLLASLGRVGQDFSLALDDADDHRDPLDDDVAPTEIRHRLHAVQESIRLLEPDLVRDACAPPDPRADSSLRVHVCHTRLRELEVLKDQLLGFLADDPTLQPRDIVVMAPDIAAYAPLLPSLFGDAARYADGSGAIPWHLADVALARTHPLFDGFTRLLDLPESRFKVSDVLEWLDIAAVARRFGFDGGARESIEPWLRRARVAWGLDAAMKGESGAAAIDANTWSFGFDRLYAGWLTGNDDAASTLVDGDIAPLSGVSGGDADAIGRLDRLIGTLRSLRDGMRAERTLPAWSEWLIGAIDTMFLADTRDDREDEAMDSLRRVAASLQTQGESVDANATFGWSVVREAIGDALGAVSERQPFLLGGVTFCGLVPQRAIPFRVVCLLGMNAGDYPRSASDGGLNYMIAKPRRGDRDTRQQDRYLFLEALMAARQALHISYLGEDVAEGGQRNPASPLAELLEYLDEQAGIAADDDETDRPWIVRHPLQPFDARYFSPARDPRLFSFDAAQAQRSDDAPPAFVDFDTTRSDAVIQTNEVPLQSLIAFWRDPAKATLRDGFGIALDALDADADLDTEPLTSKPDRRERLEERLWRDAFRAGLERVPPTPPSWLAQGGLLPAGDLAARAYLRLRERTDALLTAVRDCVSADAKEIRETVSVRIGDERIAGTIDRIFRRADGTLCLLHTQAGEVTFRHVLPFFIEWAMLRLSNENARPAAIFLACDKSGVSTPDLCTRIAAQQPAQLANGLHELMSMMRLSAQSPPFLIPKTSWAWVNAKDEQRDSKARVAWSGSREHKGEFAYEPSYASLLTRGSGFPDAASRGFAEFVRTNEWIARILDPAPIVPRSAGGDA